MAAVVHHARTRSARVTVSSSRPLQHQPRPDPVGSSNRNSGSASLGVFLMNLRLLDLDLLPDWPGITPDTFATSGSDVQGQKRRIQCVEWALFRLFGLWEPEETENNLKPFFPPLEQMQSLNLRAALLRALERAKKNGVLGRDSVIRKTMLDECRGERLEEVLASLSTAVLKKAVAEHADSGRNRALATNLALKNGGYGGDIAELGALALAHKVSLRRIIERKNVLRSRCQDLADQLSVMDRGIARRNAVLCTRKSDDGGADTLSENAMEETRRTVRNNWPGNEQWMHTLLLGDFGHNGNNLFGMPFGRVWRRVQQGRMAELEDDGAGLLEQLASRVRVQKQRLARWGAFRSEMMHHAVEPSPTRSKAQCGETVLRGIDLKFVGHQHLCIGDLDTQMTGIGRNERPPTEEYINLVDSLENDLSQIRNRAANLTGFLAQHKRRSRQEDKGAGSDISEMDTDLEPQDVVPGSLLVETDTMRLSQAEPSRHPLANDSSSATTVPRKASNPPQLLDHDMETLDPASRRSLWDSSPPASPSPQRSPVRRGTSPAGLLIANKGDIRSPTQQDPDRVLSSRADEPLSPTKRGKTRHTLSLAQRTRLSMAHASTSPFLDGDEPEPETSLTLPPLTDPKPTPAAEEVDEQDDLTSRTRRSMAGFERARQTAQLERRRSLRRPKVLAPQPQRREGGHFPPLNEETSILAEELMGRDEDMEAVFRSRPRIKASPLASPTRELGLYAEDSE